MQLSCRIIIPCAQREKHMADRDYLLMNIDRICWGYRKWQSLTKTTSNFARGSNEILSRCLVCIVWLRYDTDRCTDSPTFQPVSVKFYARSFHVYLLAPGPLSFFAKSVVFMTSETSGDWWLCSGTLYPYLSLWVLRLISPLGTFWNGSWVSMSFAPFSLLTFPCLSRSWQAVCP